MAERNDPAREATDRELVIARWFDAPAALVFDAWTDPRHMAQWWGPRGFINPVCQLDARPGGAWRIVMRGPDGGEHPAKGVYREVAKPRRLVFTIDHSELSDQWHDMVNPGRDKRKPKPPLEILATATFQEQGGKTKLTLTLRFESAAIRDGFLNVGMAQGWSQTLDRLAEQVTPSESGVRPFVVARVFNAPRELVWKAWTERDRLVQWFGPKGFTMAKATLDFRPGGVFHYCMRSPDGHEMWGKFVYREIVPGERIVLVNSFSDKDGNITRHPMSPTWPREMLSTTTFLDEAGKTVMTLRWEPLNATEEEIKTFDAARDGMSQGWAGTFEQLDEYLAKAQGA